MKTFGLRFFASIRSRKLMFIGKIIDGIIFTLSLAFVSLSIIDFAYFPSPNEQLQIHAIYHVIWIVFLFDIPLVILFKYGLRSRRGIFQRTITAIILYSTLLHFFLPVGDDGFLGAIGQIVGSKYYFTFVMLLVAFGNLGRGILRLFNRRTNPALMMASSFLLLILVGTFLLLSPRCANMPISIVDSLFVATSAVCVTGLTPLDVSSAFTVEGQVVILMLIQIGGLGVMTFTSFFALFFMGNIRLSNQLTVRELISGGTLNTLFSMLLYIFGFTMVIELAGAFSIWCSIHGNMGMTLNEDLFFSVFHSVSAFCNAGFSTLTGNLGNPMVMTGHNLLFVTVSLLIVFGGIGFPVLVNLKGLGVYHLRQFYHRVVLKQADFQRATHVVSVNTKIVLITTLVLLIGGTFSLLFFEWDGAFAQMTVVDKLTHSFFNSASTRTAGFNSINLTLFSTPSLMIYIFLMWIGGGSQSTAGGVKVNAFATAFLALRALLNSQNRVEIFKREIDPLSIIRAYGTIFVSILFLVTAIFFLSLMEPDISLFRLTFECFSAMGTVGSSLDTTQILGNPAKILITFLMFTGRIGVFTLLMSFMRKMPERKYQFPKEQIVIN